MSRAKLASLYRTNSYDVSCCIYGWKGNRRMKTEDVIKKLRELKLAYIQGNVGKNPSLLPEHVGEFLGYATILYDFYGDAVAALETMETKVTKEEEARRVELNEASIAKDEKPSVTQAEVDKRIAVRLGKLVAQKKSLEQYVKGATLHINGCQSLMKNWGDESKGIR
jgi:hypothetical protein